jgi:DNA-binding GntR family transcriptional regulator
MLSDDCHIMSEPQAEHTTIRHLSRRDSLSERIYFELRGKVQRSEVAPEFRFVDVDIATEYGTSRMPAREALLRLANEGYLVGTTRGFMVPRLSLDDIRDVFEVRRLLEPRAAANAAQHLDNQAEQDMSRALQEASLAAERHDANRMILANIAFRQAWLAKVRNRRLADTIGRFVDHAQTVRLKTLQTESTRTVVLNGLKSLHSAFMRHDPISVNDRMVAFMAAAEDAFFSIRQTELEDTADRRSLSQNKREKR